MLQQFLNLAKVLNDGPVLVTLEYYIDPGKAEEFTLAMQALARIRRRDGAIQWGLYQDVSDPSRFVETALVESWAEHRRQFERVTVSDKSIEDRVLAYHIGNEAPKVSEMVYSKGILARPIVRAGEDAHPTRKFWFFYLEVP